MELSRRSLLRSMGAGTAWKILDPETETNTTQGREEDIYSLQEMLDKGVVDYDGIGHAQGMRGEEPHEEKFLRTIDYWAKEENNFPEIIKPAFDVNGDGVVDQKDFLAYVVEAYSDDVSPTEITKGVVVDAITNYNENDTILGRDDVVDLIVGYRSEEKVPDFLTHNKSPRNDEDTYKAIICLLEDEEISEAPLDSLTTQVKTLGNIVSKYKNEGGRSSVETELIQVSKSDIVISEDNPIHRDFDEFVQHDDRKADTNLLVTSRDNRNTERNLSGIATQSDQNGKEGAATIFNADLKLGQGMNDLFSVESSVFAHELVHTMGATHFGGEHQQIADRNVYTVMTGTYTEEKIIEEGWVKEPKNPDLVDVHTKIPSTNEINDLNI